MYWQQLADVTDTAGKGVVTKQHLKQLEDDVRDLQAVGRAAELVQGGHAGGSGLSWVLARICGGQRSEVRLLGRADGQNSFFMLLGERLRCKNNYGKQN